MHLRYLRYILFCVGMSVLLGLGYWQLNRGLQKAEVESEFSISESATVETVSETTHDSVVTVLTSGEFKAVRLAGRWLHGNTFLLDNRISEGQVGFEVYTPYLLDGDGKVILVNRGWMNQSGDRSAVEMPAEKPEHYPKGTLYRPDLGFTLGDPIYPGTEWPRTFQYFDAHALGDALGIEVEKAVLVIDADHPLSLKRLWQPNVVEPSRHYAYAAQWWGLALVLAIFGIIWLKRKD
ncbi:MAG: SURF1 family protein [Pseudomonadota bacterium]